MSGWLLDRSAAARSALEPVARQLDNLAGALLLCGIGLLEKLYSARSATDYDALANGLHTGFEVVPAPPDLLERALRLQHDLAHHHGLWHRIALPDLLLAETALFRDLGVVNVDRDYDRIAEVRPPVLRLP